MFMIIKQVPFQKAVSFKLASRFEDKMVKNYSTLCDLRT